MAAPAPNRKARFYREPSCLSPTGVALCQGAVAERNGVFEPPRQGNAGVLEDSERYLVAVADGLASEVLLTLEPKRWWSVDFAKMKLGSQS
jgi:hypothetical protein